MKYILSIIIIFSSGFVYSQENYTIDFDFSEFTITSENEGYSIIPPTNRDYYLSSDTTQPALPMISINILVPSNAVFKSFTCNTTKTLVQENIYINPCVAPQPYSSNSTSNELVHYDYQDRNYPSSNVTYSGMFFLQKYRIASFSVCPFVYDAVNKKLSFISKITLSLSLATSTLNAGTVSNIGGFEDIVRNTIFNKNDIATLYPKATVSSLKSGATTCQYLVVTTAALKNDFLPLIDKKIKKGLTAEIITIEEIYNQYSGITNQLKIKNCLYDYYTNRGLVYVLLGGDNEIIPTQSCYGSVGEFVDNTIPTDLFYACFDKRFDWNYNNNDKIGELSDSMDIAPEIFISRLPVKNSEQTTAILNKTFKYEFHPQLNNLTNNILLAGAKTRIEENGVSDAEAVTNRIWDEYISPIWNNGQETRFYDTNTDFEGGGAFELNTINFRNILNNNYHFIFMNCHGNQTLWQLENGDFTTSDALALQNTNSKIIITSACLTNAFDNTTAYSNDPCLSEAFIRNPKGGAVLYWGSSRFGWGPRDGASLLAMGTSDRYNEKFFHNLFSSNLGIYSNRFGAVTTKSKINWIWNSLSDPVFGKIEPYTWLWLQYSLNAIGDPELPIYTNDPVVFSNATVTKNGTSVTVSSGGIANCRITVTSNDYGKTYFETYDGISSYTFTNVPSDFSVTITKLNYVPFVYPQSIYIQNESLDGEKYISSENIYVGKHVTTEKAEGDVYFKTGAEIILDAENELILETDIIFEEGTVVEFR